MSAVRRPIFPFSALLGQEALRQALLLLAIDPRIGGLLIEGPRGTAKSTSARAIAELLPGGAFVTLPLGATEEMLIGTLNVEAALRGGSVDFAPGLLAKAHEGVLYVDEVNLLPDILVDQLLDVAASGVNIVERDGISREHPANFALIGTMNPEEGGLRPQLLDRFGLALALENTTNTALRRDIVKARLEFDRDPMAFQARFAEVQKELREKVVRARSALEGIVIPDVIHEYISERCVASAAEGVRADIVMARAARALAAWLSAQVVDRAHVDAVAELALRHRRVNTSPEHPPGAQATPPPDTARGSSQSSGGADQDGTAAQESWGELPPQPVAALPARPIRATVQKKSP